MSKEMMSEALKSRFWAVGPTTTCVYCSLRQVKAVVKAAKGKAILVTEYRRNGKVFAGDVYFPTSFRAEIEKALEEEEDGQKR